MQLQWQESFDNYAYWVCLSLQLVSPKMVFACYFLFDGNERRIKICKMKLTKNLEGILSSWKSIDRFLSSCSHSLFETENAMRKLHGCQHWRKTLTTCMFFFEMFSFFLVEDDDDNVDDDLCIRQYEEHISRVRALKWIILCNYCIAARFLFLALAIEIAATWRNGCNFCMHFCKIISYFICVYVHNKRWEFVELENMFVARR